jgi:beta-lactamase regulating signal transducer with metallopeptidase domain
MSAVLEAATWFAIALWLAVALALTIRTLRRAHADRVAVRALPEASPSLVRELGALAHRLGAPRAALRVGGDSPRVVGLVRPTIVLPVRLACGDAADRGAILSHELAHLRRRDLWVGAIQAIAGIGLWWYPVVGWVGRRLGAAREAACDAWALARGPLPREQYARLLLSFARAPGMAFAASQLSARVDAILDRRARAGIGPAGAAVVGAFAVVGLAGASAPVAGVAAAEPCVYDRDAGASILAAYPQADRDGDGHLTRDEACDFQAELAAKAPADTLALAGDGVSEPICCNCPGSEGTSSAPVLEPISSCVEGASP